MPSSVIKADSISKQVTTNQEHLTILENVNLEINRGESVAIVGTSGAGKSTLMTLLAGLDTPTSGEITLLGKPLSKLDDEARASLRSETVGFVFQSFLLIPSLTAIENVTLPCLLKGEEEDIDRARTLLESVGLGHRENHLPTQLSGGEQQRVALARAFMIKPQILFADEPTGNLDQHTAANIVERLFDLNKQHGTTLILVTHDPELAKRCDRTFHMQAGQLEVA
ncbi:putative ABC-type dipeptide/oligopeptide/nickel transport system, ATPase component [Vibrio nigripulchritudo SO65]|uniref:ABC transporter ATP-binding protein n=1 Tax=Vibrio nigripulchritudo TaxID=28173 RepID=UPI0003B1973D|nr:ABC transporter ATP-binding protein [Vibrio nigripulchritudo]CCN35619.1 putative ABC-type dipeptide/oligopeptide/nickel transport system, ATPase component [Vibrio nigripulchritudo AM115]CCN44506.1 putative ABC-type dipeptide/oligopeptide/nickel transport system, ATPase component [Vibrio nigripulchritudo FTn2]CCN67791.1 putative ABC-type dipeptide/oligopeptide/nickel transport system, ATPase component [Vibrio nigripulchritudo POn4]CCN77183.1 putative ABC-type dipeptide/oligopeptide/nickel tra